MDELGLVLEQDRISRNAMCASDVARIAGANGDGFRILPAVPMEQL